MKALSVRQPHAERIRRGQKTIEVRTWEPRGYRGPLLICASKQPQVNDLPCGVAVAVVELVDVRPMTQEDRRAACLPFVPEGAFAWVLANVRPVSPFPVTGRLGLFDVDLAEPEPVCRGSLFEE